MNYYPPHFGNGTLAAMRIEFEILGEGMMIGG
jgi:hypothetical protein